ncbi:MAG TPA: CocE/NonD family hydrolase [Streptosporangiaceae bacterium]|nr:CocE/NonD family hydrolase [Streptosporangiaceae bacterium]
MFATRWALSPREYEVDVHEDVAVPLPDGTELVGRLYRPATSSPVPLILGFHPYSNEFQSGPVYPAGFGLQRGWMESGDPVFYARRGYAHGIFNVRGTGKSGGTFDFMGPQEADDVVNAIEWLAAREWCDGNVGMFGVSYFSRVALQAADRRPPSLKAIFAPFGLTDIYRDLVYHGGILSHGFVSGWRDKLDGLRYQSIFRRLHGDQAYERARAQALADDELMAVPALRDALENPTGPRNEFLADLLLERLDGDLYAGRRLGYENADVPAFLGACWGLYGLQLPAAFRNFERWKGPKKLLIGPPYYLDRPLYQLQYESLRWFDHWLKGNDTGFLAEPAVRLFMSDTGGWKEADCWPLPQTRWTSFYLHEDGLLSEHEMWDWETASGFVDSPFAHGGLTFLTPELIERTEVIGPAVLDLQLSTSDSDVLVFASLFALRRDGSEEELSRGWLRGSQRAPDTGRSRPFAPEHLHQRRDPLVPGQIYRLEVAIAPFGRALLPGERLGLRIKAADDEPRPDPLRATGFGHVSRQTAARVTVHHSPQRPSCLLVPVVSGNYVGTYLSGGRLEMPGPLPLAKIQRLKAREGTADGH